MYIHLHSDFTCIDRNTNNIPESQTDRAENNDLSKVHFLKSRKAIVMKHEGASTSSTLFSEMAFNKLADSCCVHYIIYGTVYSILSHRIQSINLLKRYFYIRDARLT